MVLTSIPSALRAMLDASAMTSGEEARSSRRNSFRASLSPASAFSERALSSVRRALASSESSSARQPHDLAGVVDAPGVAVGAGGTGQRTQVPHLAACVQVGMIPREVRHPHDLAGAVDVMSSAFGARSTLIQVLHLASRVQEGVAGPSGDPGHPDDLAGVVDSLGGSLRAHHSAQGLFGGPS